MTIAIDISVKKGDFILKCQAELPQSGCIAIFGPSGSGKTTLLRAIAGLERQAVGSVSLDNGRTCWQNANSFTPVHKRQIAFAFQKARLLPHLTVRGNMQYAFKRTAKDRRRDIQHIAEACGITTLLERNPRSLSGGETQRAILARCLVSGPRLLLFDEPLSALDQHARHDLVELLAQLKAQDNTPPMLYVSHHLDEVTRLADHLLNIDQGEAAPLQTMQAVLADLDWQLRQPSDHRSLLLVKHLETDVEDRLATYQLSDNSTIHLQVPFGATVGATVGIPRSKTDERPTRLCVLARDVSLCMQPATGSSILNTIPVTILACGETKSGQALVKLACGDQHLLALISQRSWKSDHFAIGQECFAQVKAISLC